MRRVRCGVTHGDSVVATDELWRGQEVEMDSCAGFFFQAEDGIRYLTVTGVQTCALPICGATRRVPDEVCVNGHAVIIRVELGEAIVCFDFFRTPFTFGQFTEGLAVEAKDRQIGRASCRERV